MPAYDAFAVRANGTYHREWDYVLIGCPDTRDELESFIRSRMLINRCLYISVGGYHSETPKWNHKVFKWLHELSCKYRPWQFRTMSQDSGDFEVNWIEVDQRLWKYGAICDWTTWTMRRQLGRE